MRLTIASALVWSACAMTARAETTVETHEVNGYAVRLVDTQAGNQFGFLFTVPYGSGDDEPALFGRAHFFEHMYLRGSKRFPGRTTVDDEMKKFGYAYNAYTSWDKTVFFANGLDESGLGAMDVLFSGLDHPELDAEAFADEKQTVIEEVVSSAPNRPARAANELPFLVLPSVGHPARGRFTGERETLDPMRPIDHRRLHEEIYHSGNVRLAVFGNLSSGRVTKAQVMEKLAEILPRREARPAYRALSAPPAFAKDAVIDVNLPNERSGSIWIPLKDGAVLSEVRTAMNAFVGVSRGGVEDVARRELGWATGVSYWTQRVGPRDYVVIDLELTKSGFAHRSEFVNWVVRCLAQAGRGEYPRAFVAEMSRRSKISLGRIGQSVPALVQNFGRWLGTPGYDALVDLDVKRHLAGIDVAAIKRGAQALDLNGKVAVFAGADETPSTALDAFSNVRYRVSAWPSNFASDGPVDPAKIRTTPVTLPSVDQKGPLASSDLDERRGLTRFIRTARPNWRERAVTLRLNFPGLSPKGRLSLAAWVHAAREELAAEFDQLAADGTSLDLDRGATSLDFDATGSTGAETAAIQWLLERLHDFTPEKAAIDRYRDEALLAINRNEDGFAGSVSSSVAGELLSAIGSNSFAMLKEIEELDHATVVDEMKRAFKATHKVLVIAGGSRDGEVRDLFAAAREFSPGDLPEASLPIVAPKTDLEHHEGWRDAGKNGVGITRVFSAPGRRDPRASAALDVIASVMHDRVFPLNRPYGYVQSISHRASTPDAHYLYLIGQTGDAESVAKIEQNWADELGRWARGEVGDEEIETAKAGSIAKIARDDATSGAAVARIFGGLLSAGDPFAHHAHLRVLRSLEVAEVRAVARAWIGEMRPSLTVRKGLDGPSTCEDLLVAREATRAQLGTTGR